MSKYESESARISLAREIAAEAMVLLKNDENILPLAPGTKAAILGKTQFDTIIGGGGSGSSFSAGTLQIDQELENAGIAPEMNMKYFYSEAATQARDKAAAQAESMKDMFKNLEGLVASGAIYEIFGRYDGPKEEPLPDMSTFAASVQETDLAILIIGRQSGGEECDRRVLNDYYLTRSEQLLIKRAAQVYSKIIVVLDVNGGIDTAWLNRYPQIKAAIFMGTCGEQAAGALADILTGKVTPSGKLSQTLALSYDDYPTADHFSSDKDKDDEILTYENYGLSAEANGSIGFARSPVTVYQEGIYVGYRYFDTFEKSVMFPFGFGLSYAQFAISPVSAAVSEGKLVVTVDVANTSEKYAGKEVVQLYVSAPSLTLDQPAKQLKAFAKTSLLAPGEKQQLTLSVRLEDLASFSEAMSAWILEAGTYKVLIGNSSVNTQPAAVLVLAETLVTRKVTADIGLTPANKGKINFLTPGKKEQAETNKEACDHNLSKITITSADLQQTWPQYISYDFTKPAEKSLLCDVEEGRVSMEAFLNQMEIKELAVLCNGYGPGLPFGGIGGKAPATITYDDGSDIGFNSHKSANPGYENPSLPKYGIYSAFYKDGPASVGKTAWPTGMMAGCTFNTDLLYEFGDACGCEAVMQDVDSWLAPGMNIIRNPIEGRAFEYFSEDPFLAGAAGTAITRGAMENNPVTTCPKHFALNEQETYRRGKTSKNYDAVDTIADARTVREIYLKPFEMVITQAKPRTIMSSFNKINGTFAAGNKTLCTDILRGEWGYTGVVVTDWGDMDAVVDGADAVAAGNDVVMPGGPPVIAQVLKGYEEGRVTAEEMKTAVGHLMNFVAQSVSQKKNQ